MSDCKCEHNNHSHFLIWFFVFSLCCGSSFTDCSGDKARMKNQISDLQYQVDQLKSVK